MDIVEFLRARLDEDEAVAKSCAEMFPPPWDVADRGWRVRIYSSEVPDVGDHAEPDWVRYPVVMEVEPDRHIDDPKWLSERVEHVRRHDPARVLREVEAKRRIIELHDKWPVLVERSMSIEQVPSTDINDLAFRASQQVAWLTEQEYVKRFGTQPPAAPMVRELAAIYADHPDYDPEWR